MAIPIVQKIEEAVGIGHQKADEILIGLQLIHAGIRELLDEARQSNEKRHYHRIAHAVVADSTGVAELRFRTHSGGWHLVSVAITGDTPSTTTGCAIYRNETSDGVNLLHVVTYGSLASDQFSDGEYVGEGEQIIVRFFGQTPGTRCTANIKFLNLTEPVRRAAE